MFRFSGLSREKIKNAYEAERDRQESARRPAVSPETERLARRKAREILEEYGESEAGDSGERMEGVAVANEVVVGRIMTGRVATVGQDDTVLTVREIFATVPFHHLPVVDGGERIVGIVSDRDLLRTISPFFGTVNEQTRDVAILKRLVNVIMTRNPVCVSPDAPVREAVRLMYRGKVSCLPVVSGEEKRLLGIITWKDVARAFCPEGFAAGEK